MGFKVQFSGSNRFKVNLNPETTTADVDSKGAVYIHGDDGATFYPSVSPEADLSWTNDKGLENPPVVNIRGPQGIQGEPGQKGDKGDTGPQGLRGEQGLTGPEGPRGQQGLQGPQGEIGPQGPKGDKGDIGPQGVQGLQGIQGLRGEKGEPGEKGPKGDTGEKGEPGEKGIPGKSAYEYAKEAGYSGTEEEFAEKLSSDPVTSWNDLTDKPFGDLPPAFDIQWDGDMTGRETVELEPGVHYAKVGDEAYIKEQLIGSTYVVDGHIVDTLLEDYLVDGPGTVSFESMILFIHSADDLIAATGMPEGSFSNGVWFFRSPECYVSRFTIGAADIKWDGDITDRELVEVDTGMYFVKVSDEVFTKDKLVGVTVGLGYRDIFSIMEDSVSEVPGGCVIGDGVAFIASFWSANEFAAANGIPDGLVSNGIWFVSAYDELHCSRLTAPVGVAKIDPKYLPEVDVDSLGLAPVAVSGSYNDLTDIPSLSQVATSGSYNDLTDKPFYEDEASIEILVVEDCSVSGNQFSFKCPELKVGTRYRLAITGYSPAVGAEHTASVMATAYSSNEFTDFSNSGWSCSFLFGQTYITIPRVLGFTSVTLRIFELGTEVKTLDEKFIPDTIARIEDIPDITDVVLTVNGQSPDENGDVEVESVTSWNDLTDKPFGIKRKFYFEEMQIKFTSNRYCITEDWGGHLHADYISFDGVIYNAHEIHNGLYGGELYGNPYIYDNALTDNGLPFVVALIHRTSYYYYAWIYVKDDYIGGEYTFSTFDEDITQLDEKYIPDTIARVEDIPEIPDIDTIATQVISKLPIYNGEVEPV